MQNSFILGDQNIWPNHRIVAESSDCRIWMKMTVPRLESLNVTDVFRRLIWPSCSLNVSLLENLCIYFMSASRDRTL